MEPELIKFKNGYICEKYIARGTYGTVYRCKNPKGEIVAVKCQEVSINDGFYGPILREIDLLTRIDHPNIIKINNHWIEDNNIFIEFPLYDQDLLSFARTQPWKTVSKFLPQIVYSLLSALKLLHDNGMLHCDVKPANVLTRLKDDQLSIVLIDLGLTMVKGGTRSELCTLTYRPPELFFCCESRVHNLKVDIWSLGVTLFETIIKKYWVSYIDEFMVPEKLFQKCGLTKKFCKKFDVNICNYTLQTKQIRHHILKHNRSVDPDLVDMVEHMLEIDPKKRWSTRKLLKHPFLKEYTHPVIGTIKKLTLFPIKSLYKHSYNRKRIILNLKSMAACFNIQDHAVILAIHLFDKYLEKEETLDSYEYVAIACMGIASNYLEGLVLGLDDLCSRSLREFGISCKKKTLFELTQSILDALNWNIGFTTLFTTITDSDLFKGCPHITCIYSLLASSEMVEKTVEELKDLIFGFDVIKIASDSDPDNDFYTYGNSNNDYTDSGSLPAPPVPDSTDTEDTEDTEDANISLCVQRQSV